MSNIAKLSSAIVLCAGLSACNQPANPALTNAAAGAALGATAGILVGGSRSDIAAGAAVGAIAGSAVPTN